MKFGRARLEVRQAFHSPCQKLTSLIDFVHSPFFIRTHLSSGMGKNNNWINNLIGEKLAPEIWGWKVINDKLSNKENPKKCKLRLNRWAVFQASGWLDHVTWFMRFSDFIGRFLTYMRFLLGLSPFFSENCRAQKDEILITVQRIEYGVFDAVKILTGK